MRLFKSISISFASRLAEQALALITSILVTRMLGPTGKGQYALVLAYFSVVVQFGNLGLMSPAAYYAARGLETARKAATSALLVSTVWGAILAYTAYLVTRAAPQVARGIDPLLLGIVLLAVPPALLQLYFSNILLGRERILLFNAAQLMHEGLRLLAAIVVLLAFQGSLTWLVGLFVFGYAVVAGVNALGALSEIDWKLGPFDLAFARDMLVKSFRVYLSTLFAFLVLRSDILLLNFFRGPYDVGIYSVGVSAADKLLLLPVTVGMMLFPKLASGEEPSDQLTARTLRFASFAMGLACALGGLLGLPAIVLLFGRSFAPAYVPFLLLLPGVFFLSIETILMYDFGSRGYPRIVYLSPLAGLLVNIILNIPLIPSLGYNGAAVSSTIAYGLMMALNIRYFRNVTGIRPHELLLPRGDELVWARDRLIAAIASRTTAPLLFLRSPE